MTETTLTTPNVSQRKLPRREVSVFSRSLSQATRIAIDLTIISGAFSMAAFIVADFSNDPDLARQFVVSWPVVLMLHFGFSYAFGCESRSWEYFNLYDATRLFCAMAVCALIMLICNGYGLPVKIVPLYLTFGFLGLAGMRASTRLNHERKRCAPCANEPAVQTRAILIGAGQAGYMVAKELLTHRDLSIRPIGFLDDDSSKHGMLIHGVPVLGNTSDLPQMIARYSADEVIVSIANAPGSMIRRVSELCKEARVRVKTIPGMFEILSGRVNISRIRDVAIEDLLRREPIELDRASIAGVVDGRTVLVTGAGGSIGSELCLQICQFNPARIILVERAENNLFHIGRQIAENFGHIKHELCIADVSDVERMDEIFRAHRPKVVFHAAAHKHVPMMEANPGEAIKNNVFGTKQLADMAHNHRVSEFVMISTDKAVNPTSVMGVSKRVAEIYIQALSQRSQTKFITVRFGNVLRSAGSVIPIFEAQIKRGGPVTVTHPDMKRYFMTIPEACQLVLQAAALGEGGEIFILDMGAPVKIVDLARDLIRLSGLRPDHDIEIRYSGLRPGEKLFEELSVSGEDVDTSRHPKIFIGRFRPHLWEEILAQLDELSKLGDCRDGVLIRKQFRSIVPEYSFDPQICQTSRGSSRVLRRIQESTRGFISSISKRLTRISAPKSAS